MNPCLLWIRLLPKYVFHTYSPLKKISCMVTYGLAPHYTWRDTKQPLWYAIKIVHSFIFFKGKWIHNFLFSSLYVTRRIIFSFSTSQHDDNLLNGRHCLKNADMYGTVNSEYGKKDIQLCRLEMAPLLNKYYWNEATLTGQNPSLK